MAVYEDGCRGRIVAEEGWTLLASGNRCWKRPGLRISSDNPVFQQFPPTFQYIRNKLQPGINNIATDFICSRYLLAFKFGKRQRVWKCIMFSLQFDMVNSATVCDTSLSRGCHIAERLANITRQAIFSKYFFFQNHTQPHVLKTKQHVLLPQDALLRCIAHRCQTLERLSCDSSSLAVNICLQRQIMVRCLTLSLEAGLPWLTNQAKGFTNIHRYLWWSNTTSVITWAIKLVPASKAGWGWDTVSINATQSHPGEHLVVKRLYAILKYV